MWHFFNIRKIRLFYIYVVYLVSHSGGNRMSDHRALKFTFKINTNVRGEGYWKFNSMYLNNDDYKTGIREICLQLTDMPDIGAIDKWELFKINKVKDFSINFAKYYQNSMKAKICRIENEINDIEESGLPNFRHEQKKAARMLFMTKNAKVLK